MEKETSDIEALIAESLCGELSEKGRDRLDNWLRKSQENRTRYESAKTVWNNSGELFRPTRSIPEPLFLKKKQEGLKKGRNIFTARKVIWWTAGLAASIVVFATLSYMFFSPAYFRKGSVGNLSEDRQITVSFGDNEKKSISELRLSKNLGNVIYDTATNTIKVNKPFSASIQKKMTSLEVPRGKRINVLLADGTAVAVNSSSKLTFPDRFSGYAREVFIEGEAFFKVTTSNKPFLVRMGGLNVKVLGTEFNVSNYKGENKAVTLREGKVALYQFDERESRHLKPGQQALVRTDNNKKLVIRKVNVEEYVSWKDGLLIFEDRSFEELEAALERWFDVDIDNRNASFALETFSGQFAESDDIEYAMELFGFRTDIEYSFQEKRVTIE
ncbi:iron dicitrate transporter FecR [Fulvitalea axinellae]|uniref:Iron dicitrate transporter FecR n=1 Tax=Fulvitalea axinellae TaxID=1182444 RepID=A0AAU9CN75_9BACT|nr:iron dicitrate transporter FecR [Fulvitalea axinellae]